jgi:hypothetical protein
MISARLIKNLEKKGFQLEFPSYTTNEEEIIEILRGNNERLYLAIPLLLKDPIDYIKIINKISKDKTKRFNRIIIIANDILKLEKINNNNLKEIIKKYRIKEKIGKNEFAYYYISFKDATKSNEKNKEDILKEQITARGNLNTNLALSEIFAPGKIRIMKKIFNHEKLTNTELKYYYRSIRPLIASILNENLQKYIRIIESTKKLR